MTPQGLGSLCQPVFLKSYHEDFRGYGRVWDHSSYSCTLRVLDYIKGFVICILIAVA